MKRSRLIRAGKNAPRRVGDWLRMQAAPDSSGIRYRATERARHLRRVATARRIRVAGVGGNVSAELSSSGPVVCRKVEPRFAKGARHRTNAAGTKAKRANGTMTRGTGFEKGRAGREGTEPHNFIPPRRAAAPPSATASSLPSSSTSHSNL